MRHFVKHRGGNFNENDEEGSIGIQIGTTDA